jgi:ankyrin repeat protein
MNSFGSLFYRASLNDYWHQAQALLDELTSRAPAATWRFKWLHPRFRGKPVTAVSEAQLDLADAQMVVAREYGFETWKDLEEFTRAVERGGPIDQFEAAVEAVVSGDLQTLQAMLRNNPQLAKARSTRKHHATLLHYIAANGVEGERQKTPANAVEIAKMLLNAGAEVDALADMYEQKCTTMSMLVSSAHPAKAGVQAELAETLLDFGAALEGAGSQWMSPLLTALAFGYLNTAQALARRGAPAGNLPAAAGLGRVEDVARLLPAADPKSRHIALALAAQHGHAEVVRLLLDAGEDPNRYNPDGYHSHSTPLHQAALSENADVARVLIDGGARLDIQDTVYQGTPLDWAIYCDKPAMAEYLRSRGAATANS